MLSKRDPGWRTWLNVTTAVLLVVCLNTCSVYGAGVLPKAGSGGCTNNAIAVNDTECPREYLRCEDGIWRRSMCVGGIVNPMNGECLPYSKDCPDPGVTMKTFQTRSKRQAPSIDNCLRSYQCPSDLTSIFIYPDWANTYCDSYIVCAFGTLLVSSCIRDGYAYYNPRRLSCEEIASSTNICVFRQSTNLDPVFSK